MRAFSKSVLSGDIVGGERDSPDSHVFSGSPVTTSELLGLRILLVWAGGAV